MAERKRCHHVLATPTRHPGKERHVPAYPCPSRNHRRRRSRERTGNGVRAIDGPWCWTAAATSSSPSGKTAAASCATRSRSRRPMAPWGSARGPAAWRRARRRRRTSWARWPWWPKAVWSPAPGGVLIRDAAGLVLGAVGLSGDTGENDEVVRRPRHRPCLADGRYWRLNRRTVTALRQQPRADGVQVQPHRRGGGIPVPRGDRLHYSGVLGEPSCGPAAARCCPAPSARLANGAPHSGFRTTSSAACSSMPRRSRNGKRPSHASNTCQLRASLQRRWHSRNSARSDAAPCVAATRANSGSTSSRASMMCAGLLMLPRYCTS